MVDRLTRCTACDGRGYFRCECWPGDCICGLDDQDCDECGGEGIIDNFYADDFYPTPPTGTAPHPADGGESSAHVVCGEHGVVFGPLSIVVNDLGTYVTFNGSEVANDYTTKPNGE